MDSCSGKNSWPELVGVYGQAAAAIIERENKNVNAIVVEEGSSVSGDFRCDRVRVWVDGNGLVTEVPKVG
ncbi:UNVERIFIED_CONTAM: Inhibitor of trypsin and hageman factor [Sesamum angustifolium]|uniref:Inhibitor of trypsin and hageman factor n=1 Tax=Sesamum angustifolium TaxID=2727405 RepID=A0AAW2LT04_9LAMI